MGQDIHDNPLGTDGFEFVEFTSPDPVALAKVFEAMGFTAVARHRSKNVLRYKQGDVDFILNMEPNGQAAEFRGAHGPSINAMAFRQRPTWRAIYLPDLSPRDPKSARKAGHVPVSGLKLDLCRP